MAENVKIPGEFDDDDNDYWKHPIYDNWEANRLGVVRHVKHKKELGRLSKSGYILIGVYNKGILKSYLKHRFIYECFFGLIEDPNKVVDHKNNIKTDNQLENLQLISQSQNQIKEYRKGKHNLPISVRATNIDTGKSSDYYSIYECSRKLDINQASISRVLNGIIKTTTSKLDKNKYIFEKIESLPYKQKGVKRPPIRVRAIKLDTNETLEYNSITKCSNDLDIYRSSIARIINGECKSAISKKDNCLYRFEKL